MTPFLFRLLWMFLCVFPMAASGTHTEAGQGKPSMQQPPMQASANIGLESLWISPGIEVVQAPWQGSTRSKWPSCDVPIQAMSTETPGPFDHPFANPHPGDSSYPVLRSVHSGMWATPDHRNAHEDQQPDSECTQHSKIIPGMPSCPTGGTPEQRPRRPLGWGPENFDLAHEQDDATTQRSVHAQAVIYNISGSFWTSQGSCEAPEPAQRDTSCKQQFCVSLISLQHDPLAPGKCLHQTSDKHSPIESQQDAAAVSPCHVGYPHDASTAPEYRSAIFSSSGIWVMPDHKYAQEDHFPSCSRAQGHAPVPHTGVTYDLSPRRSLACPVATRPHKVSSTPILRSEYSGMWATPDHRNAHQDRQPECACQESNQTVPSHHTNCKSYKRPCRPSGWGHSDHNAPYFIECTATTAPRFHQIVMQSTSEPFWTSHGPCEVQVPAQRSTTWHTQAVSYNVSEPFWPSQGPCEAQVPALGEVTCQPQFCVSPIISRHGHFDPEQGHHQINVKHIPSESQKAAEVAGLRNTTFPHDASPVPEYKPAVFPNLNKGSSQGGFSQERF